MAYGVKYRGEFKDDVGALWQIDILKDGYDGAINTMLLGGDPLKISWEGSGDDQYKPVKPSEVYIEVISESSYQYIEFALNTSREYQVKVYKYGSTLYWIGFVDPEYFNEPYICAPYKSIIHAVDGLAMLKEIDYPGPQNYLNTTPFRSMLEFIHRSLNELGFEIDIQVGLNFSFTDSDNNTVNDRVLEELFIDYRIYRTGGDSWTNCYDILSEILTPFRAVIFMRWGRWMILNRDHNTLDGTVSINRYSYDGTYEATNDFVFIHALTASLSSNNFRFISPPPSLTIRAPYKSYKINHEQGALPSIMRMYNHDGRFYSDEFTPTGNLYNWTSLNNVQKEQGDSNSIRIKGIHLNTGGPYPGWWYPEYGASKIGYIQHQCFTISGTSRCENFIAAWSGANDDNRITLKFSLSHRAEMENSIYTSTVGSSPVNIPFYGEEAWVQVVMVEYCGEDHTTYFAGKDSDTGRYFMDTTESRKMDFMSYLEKWTDEEIEIQCPMTSTTADEIRFYIRLFEYTFDGDQPNVPISPAAFVTLNPDISDGGILFKDVKLYFNFKDSDFSYTNTISENINTNHRLTDEFEVKFGNTRPAWMPNETGHGDDTDNDGRQFMFSRVVTDDAYEPVKRAGTKDDGVAGTWINAIHRSKLTYAYRYPKFLINGTIADQKGAIDSIDTVIQDYASRLYAPISLTYRVRDCQYDGQWVQLDETGVIGDFETDSFGDSFFKGG